MAWKRVRTSVIASRLKAFSYFTDTFISGIKSGWKYISGTWTGNYGASTSTTASSYPYLATKMAGSDVVINVTTASQGSGAALWVTDSGDWFGVISGLDPGQQCNPVCNAYSPASYNSVCGYNSSGCNSSVCGYNGNTNSVCGYNNNTNNICGYNNNTNNICGYNGGNCNAFQYRPQCLCDICTGNYNALVAYYTGCNSNASPYYSGCNSNAAPYYSGCNSNSSPYYSGCNSCWNSTPYYSGCNSTYYVCSNTTYSTCYPSFIRIIKRVSGTVSEVVRQTMSQAVNSLKVTVSGSQITAKAYSDSALTSQIDSDFVYTPLGNTITTSYGIVLGPSSYNQGSSVGAVTITKQ